MRRRRPGPATGLVQVSLAGVLWGTGGLAVQLVRRQSDLSPLTLSAYRTAIAAVVVVAATVLLRRAAAVRAVLAVDRSRAIAVGLLTASYQAFYFGSVVLVGVTVSTVVSLGLAPVVLSLVRALRERDLPGGREIARIAAALSGLVLVGTSSGRAGTGTGPHPVLGVVLALASGTAYAAATALGEPLARRSDALAVTAITTSVGAVALVPLALVVGGVSGGPLVSASPAVLALLGYLGAVTMALAYALLYSGLRTTTSAAAVLATLLEPVTAALAAAVVLGEQLGASGVIGGVLILAAIASSRRDPPPQAL